VRPSHVDVDLQAIRDNVAAIGRVVAPSSVCAVVKADAYGHGDVPAAEMALAGGAAWLAVALVEEGIRLREAGIEAPILLLSEPAPEAAARVVEWRLVPTVYRESFVAALVAAAAGRDALPVHLKVDTGMHRVGAGPEDALDLALVLEREPGLHLQGLWTHLSVAEEDQGFTCAQLEQFDAFRSRLAAAGIEPELVHAANTAGALGYPQARYSMVRPGLGIYGLRPTPDFALEVPLSPAMRVVSEVAFVRELPAGARPSYGRRRPMPRAGTTATIPIGYADGISRRLFGQGGGVLIRGKRYPFAGTVTMDQIIVDVGDDEVAVGDEVVVMGTQGSAAITADEWAERLGTINYEIVCSFGPRLPRRYRRWSGA
jgi:alanine racemase